jgi:hypothetical protein
MLELLQIIGFYVIAWVAVGLFVYGLIVVLPSGREQEDVSLHEPDRQDTP